MADENSDADAARQRGAEGEPAAEGAARPAWMSNVVEVQFEGGLRPDVLAAEGAACEFVGDAEASSSYERLNEILSEGRCHKAVRAFDGLPEELASELSPLPGATDLSGFYLLHFPEETDGRAVAEKLRAVPGVKYAAAVPKIKPASAVTLPDDDLLNPKGDDEYQWYIFRCGVERAWACGLTGKGVVIADIDFGFRTNHPDLEPRINHDRAFNALDGSGNVSVGEDLHHGTAVLGLAGAAADHKGLVGVAHGAELWPVQANVLPSEEPGTWGNAILRALALALKDGKRVVIIVEGQSGDDGNVTQIRFVRQAVLYCIAAGAVVCIPAGNGNRPVNRRDGGGTFRPVGLIVGATDIDDQRWVKNQFSGSNFGPEVVVAAPGDTKHDLTCSDRLEELYFATFGATSGATAKVAGAVALMLEANPLLSHDDVVEILRSTGKPVAGKPLGNLLDCGAAVCAAKTFAPGEG
jgi:subtilisin family serine protease